jgi:hypothetical protein
MHRTITRVFQLFKGLVNGPEGPLSILENSIASRSDVSVPRIRPVAKKHQYISLQTSVL